MLEIHFQISEMNIVTSKNWIVDIKKRLSSQNGLSYSTNSHIVNFGGLYTSPL